MLPSQSSPVGEDDLGAADSRRPVPSQGGERLDECGQRRAPAPARRSSGASASISLPARPWSARELTGRDRIRTSSSSIQSAPGCRVVATPPGCGPGGEGSSPSPGIARHSRTLVVRCPSRSRSSSWPPARARACGRDLPKVLHRVCGKPMVEWVIDAAREAGAERVVCVVRPGRRRRRGPAGRRRGRRAARGRGHRRRGARRARARRRRGPVVVLSGDHPLVTAEQIAGLLDASTARPRRGATMLTTDQLDPAGYGRIVRDGDGDVRAHRRDQVHRAACPPRSSRSARSTSAPTSSRRPALFDGARRGRPTRTASATSPASSRCCAPTAPGSPPHATDDLDAPLGVNDRADLMEAEELAQRAHPRASTPAPGVTFLAPGHHSGRGGRDDRRRHHRSGPA